MRRTVILFLAIAICSMASYANAYIDDAKVLGGLSSKTDMYKYLNYYGYRIWLSNHRYSIHDMYINQDDSVIVDTWNGHLGHVYILKPNYTTNKGVSVGMTLQDIFNAYGEYSSEGGVQEIHYNDYYKDDSGYITIEYVSEANEGLFFVLNKYTKKIVLIRYQSNRHGNSTVLADVKEYNLLPYLR